MTCFKKNFIEFFLRNSILFINIRYKKILFSTELLKSKFKSLNNVYYNYVLKDFKYKDLNQKRVYDIIFYIRRHRNKNRSYFKTN